MTMVVGSCIDLKVHERCPNKKKMTGTFEGGFVC